MFKKILSLFKKSPTSIIIQLNDKIQPIDRGLVYEDPINEFLKENNYGEVTGGGTSQNKSGEIEFCDIEIEVAKMTDLIIKDIIAEIEKLGAPKGSKLILLDTNNEIQIGKKEGMAVYLDGQNLPSEVYENCDVNFVLDKLHKLTNISQNADRNWQGDKETAIYFYSHSSFSQMKNSIADFIESYPLCQGARIVQIA